MLFVCVCTLGRSTADVESNDESLSDSEEEGEEVNVAVIWNDDDDDNTDDSTFIIVSTTNLVDVMFSPVFVCEQKVMGGFL